MTSTFQYVRRTAMLPNSPNSLHPGRSRIRTGRSWTRLPIALAVAGAIVALAGCGSSSKPAYCSNRDALQNSIKSVPGLVSSANLSGLRAQATKIQTEATTLVDSAKSDFPNETGALKSAVDTLSNTVDALPSSPSTQDYAKVAVDVVAAASAISKFSSATSSKCS